MPKTIFRTIRTCGMTEPPVSIARIALTFNYIALASFGGGLSAWSRHVVVEQRRWMAEEEFLSAMTVCRVLPGANQINLAVFVGARLRGAAGAVAAVVGLVALPAVIVMAMGAFYIANRESPSVQAILRGMTAAAVALSLSMAYRTGKACLNSLPAWTLFAAALFAAAVLRVPLLLLLAVLAPPAMWWAWPRRAIP
jgi:chromate transporter